MLAHELAVTTLTSVQGRGEEDDEHCDCEFRRKPLTILMILGVALEIYLQNEETNIPHTWIRKKKCVSLERKNIDKHCSNPMFEIAM